jgi:hypothetical protein
MSLECEKNTVNKCIFLVRYETCAFLCRKQNSFSSLASEAMSTFNQQLLRLLVLGLLFSIQPSTEDRSVSDISGLGEEFVPVDNSLPPLLTCTAKKLLYCHLECNKRADCRTFDYDADSRQCRLWDADMTTGSTVASPSKPQSSVGTIQLSPSLYVNIHNQSCDKCFQSRYETCDTNSSTCQCPLKSYWNGLMCSAQLFLNQTCSQGDMCRSDLNLTCQPSCDFTYQCSDRKSYFSLSL